MSYLRKYIDIINEEGAPPGRLGQPMTIMVHNSGFRTEKKPTQVFNTDLRMDSNGRPQLWFSFRQNEHPGYYADFTPEGWVADMD